MACTKSVTNGQTGRMDEGRQNNMPHQFLFEIGGIIRSSTHPYQSIHQVLRLQLQ